MVTPFHSSTDNLYRGVALKLYLFSDYKEVFMSVNEIGNAYQQVTSVYGKKENTKEETKEEKITPKVDTEESAVYEGSVENSEKTYTISADRQAIIDQLKADQEARTLQLQSLVEKMFAKQGQTLANADDMWKFLASGKYEVDPETKAQAQKDIAEDGYWGVEQTSERILSFAKALAGDNVELIDKMQAAVEKGFKEATKAWGKDLPEICEKTLDAVHEKFAAWKEAATKPAETADDIQQ